MKKFVEAWHKNFNDNKYPKGFYFDSIKAVKLATNKEELANIIIGLLHWKDGKVKKIHWEM